MKTGRILLREWLNATLKTGPTAQVKWIEGYQQNGKRKTKAISTVF
jgi:hypothetical protein